MLFSHAQPQSSGTRNITMTFVVTTKAKFKTGTGTTGA
jgi:hypothetical protein